MRKLRWRLFVGVVLIFGVAVGLRTWRASKLPHKMLRKGGEMRVVQIHYGAGGPHENHTYQRAPEWGFRVWGALPNRLQQIIPPPEEGQSMLSSDHPAISIWWAWIDPETHVPMLTESSSVSVKLDNGETLDRIWPWPSDDYRQILIIDPPRGSRRLRVKFHIWGEAVHFTIDNPACQRP